MITTKLNKLALLLLLAFFCACLPAFSELSEQTLRGDLNYYRSTAKQKNLNSNDRVFILNRINEKYQGSGVDITPLNVELDKAAAYKAAPQKAGAVKKARQPGRTAPSKAKGARGKIEKIFISETREYSKIFIAATGVARSNYFLMKDPASGNAPKIVLDLYGVEDKLSQAASDISPKEGIFSNVSAGRFEGPPNNVVRVIAALRKDAPYTVKKEPNIWIISVNKTGLDAKAASEAVQPPAGPAMTPAESYFNNTGGKPEAVPAPAPAAAAEDGQAPPAEPAKPPKSVTDDYKIESSDILGITVYPADELSREAIVQPDGNIAFPLIGSAHAQGLTIKQLEKNLSESLSRYISSPQVTITVKQFSRRQIFITGEVRGVGAYNFKENLRLLEFISSIGGFTEQANRKEVKIYRGPPTKRQVHVVNVEELVKSGDFSKDFLLESGDIIEVTKGQAKVAILGDIKSPGYYDYKENMHLIELVSTAGGFSDTSKITDISIIRQVSENKQTVVKVNLKRILSGKDKDILVQSGDTVFFPKGNLASANWFLTSIMPWISLVTLLAVIRI